MSSRLGFVVYAVALDVSEMFPIYNSLELFSKSCLKVLKWVEHFSELLIIGSFDSLGPRL